ncbi:MAG: type II and III secretion system protein [Polyangiaceae bacterium]|nr:type II and III secretion system protein [Polyangiaceae bacterium]
MFVNHGDSLRQLHQVGRVVALTLCLYCDLAFADSGPGSLSQRIDSGLRVVSEQRPASSDSSSREIELTLQVGEQRVLSAHQVKSYSEGLRGIVDIRLTKSREQFVLVGLTPGETTLLFILVDGQERRFKIHIEGENKSRLLPHRVLKEKNIRLDFYFVQLERAGSLQAGVGYPTSVSAGSFGAQFDFMTQSFQSATAVVEDQALLRLDMAASNGWAKLMRRAAVIAENGRRASFSGGGEVNIPVQGSLTTGIHRIAFGSTIEVLPTYDSETGRLKVELVAEVSDLTDDQGSGAPGRVNSTLETTVNLESGQAIVLGGLSAENRIRNKTGLPFLSEIPVIGFLFGTTRRRSHDSEIVVFIVPTVIESATWEQKKKLEAALEQYVGYSGRKSESNALRKQWSGRSERDWRHDAEDSTQAEGTSAQ